MEAETEMEAEISVAVTMCQNRQSLWGCRTRVKHFCAIQEKEEWLEQEKKKNKPRRSTSHFQPGTDTAASQSVFLSGGLSTTKAQVM